MSCLKECAQLNPYYHINREEQNLAAILFVLLQNPENFDLFVNRIGCKYEVVDEEFGIYNEYAFIRDIWHGLGSTRGGNVDGGKLKNQNTLKKKIVLSMLKNLDFPGDFIYKLENDVKSIRDFNKIFIDSKNISKDYIQSPANWSISALVCLGEKKFHEEVMFKYTLLASKVKWAFNCKPDIVVHFSKDKAVCFELKFESPISRYPSNSGEKMKLRQLASGSRCEYDSTSQLAVQKFLFKEMLGIEAMHVLVNKSGKVSKKILDEKDLVDGSEELKVFSWKYLLDGMTAPPIRGDYIQRTIDIVCGRADFLTF